MKRFEPVNAIAASIRFPSESDSMLIVVREALMLTVPLTVLPPAAPATRV
jgi:hypothetical protein